MVFGPIEQFLKVLKTGVVDSEKNGIITFEDYHKERYAAIPAVRVFVGALERLCGGFNIKMSFDHIKKMCNRLDACMPITKKEVEESIESIKNMKKAYMHMDVFKVEALVKTELISLEVERLNLDS